jgi:hypothetical protein
MRLQNNRRSFHADYLNPGDHNVIDDITGFKEKASECKLLTGSQKGLFCHESQWNPAQPQLYLSSKPDNMNVPNVRAPGPNVFNTNVQPGDL